MWLLIIPLILGDPSAPFAHREIQIQATSRADCHAQRLRLRDLMYAQWPPDSNNAGVARVDQPPSVNPRWRYQRAAEVGFCVQTSNPVAAR
jgi:hypothetical protein